MTPATSPKIIVIVVVAIALLAVTCVTTLSWVIIFGVVPDPVLLTAYVGITTGIVGTLAGLLVSTKSATGTQEPIQTTVTNTPQNPVNVTEPVAQESLKV